MSKKYVRRKIEWPTHQEVARLIVEAARIEGEDPIAVATGRPRSRARVYAFLSLSHDFPKIPQYKLMSKCGATEDNAAIMAISAVQIARLDAGKGAKWFDLDRMNAIRARCGLRALAPREASFHRVFPSPKARARAASQEAA